MSKTLEKVSQLLYSSSEEIEEILLQIALEDEAGR